MSLLKTSAKKLCQNFNIAVSGFYQTYRTQCAFREETLLCLILLLIALWLPLSCTQKILLIFPLFFVLAAELTNTAIETAIDRISKEWHPLSKQAKDIGSAIVLLALTQLIVFWSLILYHAFLK